MRRGEAILQTFIDEMFEALKRGARTAEDPDRDDARRSPGRRGCHGMVRVRQGEFARLADEKATVSFAGRPH